MGELVPLSIRRAIGSTGTTSTPPAAFTDAATKEFVPDGSTTPTSTASTPPTALAGAATKELGPIGKKAALGLGLMALLVI
jgi:hypothetical protein